MRLSAVVFVLRCGASCFEMCDPDPTMIADASRQRAETASTIVVSASQLQAHAPELANRARIEPEPVSTLDAGSERPGNPWDGSFVGAAVPVFGDDGNSSCYAARSC